MTLFGLPPWIILAFLFALGASLGSFLNVCIYRIPQRDELWASLRGLVSPPSSCPKCANRIPFQDNVPIFGWIKLRGRCRFCKLSISPRYPLIELANGLLFVVVYWFEIPFEFTNTVMADSCLFFSENDPREALGSTSRVAILHWRYLYHMILIEALVVASFIDFDLKIIPDGCTMPAMATGLLMAFAVGDVYIVPVWFQEPELLSAILPEWVTIPEWANFLVSGAKIPGWVSAHPNLHGLCASIVGLVVGGGIVWIVRIIGKHVLHREAMGFGDVVLMALIGSFLGWQPTIIVFFLAPLAALAVVGVSFVFWRGKEIPYGPYLSLATLVLILGWKQIWPYFEQFFSIGVMVIPAGIVMVVLLYLTLQLVQLMKRLLGLPLYPPEWIEEWTSADQLIHLAGERNDITQGRWRKTDCESSPIISAGRGQSHYYQWRHQDHL